MYLNNDDRIRNAASNLNLIKFIVPSGGSDGIGFISASSDSDEDDAESLLRLAVRLFDGDEEPFWSRSW